MRKRSSKEQNTTEPTPSNETQSSGDATRFQKFKITRVHRSKLKNAPYNPRVISDKAKAKIKANLKKVGLVEPVIWNSKTGNLVGGHQRIAALDALEGSSDYFIDVSEVVMDDKTEKEQNIFLNNGESQGEWDLQKLESLFKEDKIGIEESGFDKGSIYDLLGADISAREEEELMEMASRLREMQNIVTKKVEKEDGESDSEFYLVAVFDKDSSRKKFLSALGMADTRYIDGKFLVEKLGANGDGPDIAEEYLENDPRE